MYSSVKGNQRTDVKYLTSETLGWDAMIRDAKKRIEDLNFSIKVFERKKAAGEPWPGTQSDHQSETAAT
jgi:hypothetical protein